MTRKYQQFYLPVSLLLLFIIYAIRIGVNDVWYPNESFYADSARNWMEGRGNWFEFWYNDARRFNKPPGTYWAIYITTLIFGLSEFSLRISMPVFAIGSVFYTYKLGHFLYGEKAGLLSGAILAVSLQFIANIRYATPEIPLCFAFAGTMYYFIKALKTGDRVSIWLAWSFLGLTVFTKGFPYYIIIGGVVVIYLLWSSKSIQTSAKALWDIKIIPGGLLALTIGLIWPLYSYFVERDGFIHMYGSETVGRAYSFTEYSYSIIEQLKFYPEAMTWAFLPYSVAMYIGLFLIIKNKAVNGDMKFLFSWIIVMYVIFTISSGKLPTYFIQAHPALSVITAYAMINYKSIFNSNWIKSVSIYLPATLGFILPLLTLYFYQASYYWYFIPFITLALYLYVVNNKEDRLLFLPFATMIPFIFIFFAFILSAMETFRPNDIIGATLEKTSIPRSVPIYMHKHRMHNIPYYTGHKIINDLEDEDVLDLVAKNESALILVRDSLLHRLPPHKIVWNGPLFYAKTEGKFFQYFKANQKAMNDNMEDYIDYSLLFFNDKRLSELE